MEKKFLFITKDPTPTTQHNTLIFLLKKAAIEVNKIGFKAKHWIIFGLNVRIIFNNFIKQFRFLSGFIDLRSKLMFCVLKPSDLILFSYFVKLQIYHYIKFIF